MLMSWWWKQQKRSHRILNHHMFSWNSNPCFQNFIQPWTTTQWIWAKLISKLWLISSWRKFINLNQRFSNKPPMYSKIPPLSRISIRCKTTLKALVVTPETKRVHWAEIVTLDTGKIFCVLRTSKPLETLLTWTSKTRRITQTLPPFRMSFKTWNNKILLLPSNQ